MCVCTLYIVPMAMCVLVYVWVSVRDDFELTRANVFGDDIVCECVCVCG